MTNNNMSGTIRLISLGGRISIPKITGSIESGIMEKDPIFTAWLNTPPNISTFTNDVGYIEDALSDGKTYGRKDGDWTEITGGGTVAWDEITGNQTDINLSGFTDDVGYLTTESDPVFSSWLSTTPPLYPGGWYDTSQASINVSGFSNDAGYMATTTTSTTNIYVETTGSDVTGDGTIGSPYRTISKALNSIEQFLSGVFIIRVGTGTFAGYTLRKNTAGSVRIIVWGTPTVLVAETTATSGTTETITVTGAGWTPSAYAGKFIRMTAGTGYLNDTSTNPQLNNLYPIIDNTADTLTLPVFSSAFNNTSKFEIVEQGTIISNGLYNYAERNIDHNPKYMKITSTVASGYLIFDSQGQTTPRGCEFQNGASGQYGLYKVGGYINPVGCRFNSGLRYGVYLRGGDSIAGTDRCYFDTVDYPFYVSDPNASIYLNGNKVTGALIGIQSRYNARVDAISSTQINYIDDSGVGIQADYGGVINAAYIRTKAVTNTIATKVANGGKIFRTADITGTTEYDISDMDSVIYATDDSIERRTNLYKQTKTLSNNAYIDLPEGVSGFGEVIAGDNQEYTQFRFTTAGVVTLLNNTANVVDTDTVSKLCILDNGSNVRIKNRLGSSKEIKVVVNY